MSADIKAEDQPQHGCEQIEAKDHSQSCATLRRISSFSLSSAVLLNRLPGNKHQHDGNR